MKRSGYDGRICTPVQFGRGNLGAAFAFLDILYVDEFVGPTDIGNVSLGFDLCSNRALLHKSREGFIL